MRAPELMASGWMHAFTSGLKSLTVTLTLLFHFLLTEHRAEMDAFTGSVTCKALEGGPRHKHGDFSFCPTDPTGSQHFPLPLEYPVVKGKGSSHLSFCTLTAHAYFFSKATVQRWLFHLKVARSEAHCAIFHVTPVFAPTLPFQNSSYPSLWQWEQSLTQCCLCCSSIYLTFFSSSYYFPLNLHDASDQSWLPFSSSAWHPIREWPWECIARRARTHRVALWNQEKPSNFFSRLSSEGC